jgi:glycosyltransferase involved in cell wall biosynthesis
MLNGSKLKILITNNTLADHAGTELYVRDLAVELLKRGHTPIAYSTLHGAVAEELRAATVPVIADLDSLAAPPDLIHGHHHLETMTALLRFPRVPAIYFCHGWLPWEELPPKFPRIMRYVAVDETCHDRLVHEHAIPEGRVRLILNFVDLKRFKPRDLLPAKPKRTLVFSNNATENSNLPAIRQACTRAKVELDVVGSGAANPTSRPEDVLPKYDLVFAKGRAALEALSVGTAVVLCDTAGVGPMVTTANMRKLRSLNFGIRALQNPLDPAVLVQQIARYNASDAMQVSSWIRQTAAMDDTLDHLIELYEEVLEEHRKNPAADYAAEVLAASAYLRHWIPNLTLQRQARARHETLRIEYERLRAECQSWHGEGLRQEGEYLREQCQNLQRDRDALKCQFDAFQRKYTNVEAERDSLRSELDRIYGSLTLQLRNRLVALPGVGQVLRSCVKFIAGRG